MPVSDASILKSTLAWGCGSSTWSLLAVSRRDQPLQLCRLHVEAGPTASPVRCPLCLSKAVIYSTPPERPVVAGKSLTGWFPRSRPSKKPTAAIGYGVVIRAVGHEAPFGKILQSRRSFRSSLRTGHLPGLAPLSRLAGRFAAEQSLVRLKRRWPS